MAVYIFGWGWGGGGSFNSPKVRSIKAIPVDGGEEKSGSI